ncbi:hypothetical protein [uncultured Maricaulis sp.]|uniref:hypothetical protein n=1 Tax=uncultured Maricaulis sp. TaxID=174710 RepID=UPI0030DAB328
MIASLIASVLAVASTEFSDDPEQHSVWMQQACRIQQVGYGGGEPDDYTAFCVCFDDSLREQTSAPVYRAFALGSQGAIREQGMIEDWEAARDTAASEAGAMDPAIQAQFTSYLQTALTGCVSLAYPSE